MARLLPCVELRRAQTEVVLTPIRSFTTRCHVVRLFGVTIWRRVTCPICHNLIGTVWPSATEDCPVCGTHMIPAGSAPTLDLFAVNRHIDIKVEVPVDVSARRLQHQLRSALGTQGIKVLDIRPNVWVAPRARKEV